ncbi:hypothetical protein [Photobacterium indicum]
MPELIESVMNCEVSTENEQDFVTLDGFVSWWQKRCSKPFSFET